MGNGGSSATPSHSAGDWSKELGIKTICLTDNTPVVTALANDTDYSNIFKGQLEVFLKPGDIVIGYSGSGNSENVINNLTIKSGLITQKQSEIIFENAKIFPNHTQISIAIIKDGKVNYYGINNKNDTISTVNNKKSVFEIGSISKVFTSTILANFVIDEKINLNDNINGYLKTSFNNNSETFPNVTDE